MPRRYLTLILVFSSCLLSVFAQEGIESFSERTAFTLAVRDISTLDFEGIVPNSGFKHFQREGSLRHGGLEIRPGGGARFGAGAVYVVGGWYQAGSAYETTTGAKIHWSPPNQPGNAYLEVTLPEGATAVATDLWAVQPAQSTVDVTVTTADGKTRTETVTTVARPAAGFIGFASEAPIVSIRFTPPKGQTGLIVDNFAFGKSAGLPAGERVRPVQGPGAVPKVLTTPREIDAPKELHEGPSDAPTTRSDAGVIAYVRGSKEIRLINPDGSGDRQLWTHPDLIPPLGIFELAWKPDGTELAFSSAHEGLFSAYMADIYTIRRDGSNLKRITNPPDRAGLARLPKGSVTVKVSNFQPAEVAPGNLIVYVVGADEPQQVHIPAGTSKTITFKSVADFGREPQSIVAISGQFRWTVPGSDVIAGRNVTAPMFPISGQGIELQGAFRPVWRADGSRISYRNGLCLVSSSSLTPAPGTHPFNPFFAGKNPGGTCAWDWGPTSATANQVIYSANDSGSNIYQMTEGGAHPGTKVTQFSELDYQLVNDLHWIPDGSGLLYSIVDLYRESSNIFRYDLATKRTTQVTKLPKEFAREFSISPDSKSVVFERCTTREEDEGCDLWTIDLNGSGARLLVKNGQRPTWGK